MTILNQHLNGAGGGTGASGSNSNQTFRSDSLTMNMNNAFPELSQFSQTQGIAVPAKLYQKGGTVKLQKGGLKARDLSSLLKVPSTHVYSQPSLPMQ